jgi:translocation and assembly module TamB
VLKLSEFSLHTGRNEDLQLAQPAQLRFAKLNPTTASNVWTLDSQPFRWAGTNRTMELEGDVVWPERGSFRIAGQNLTSDLFEDFLAITNTRVTLDHLAVSGSWSNSPVTFAFESTAQLDTKRGYVFSFHGVANADASGIKVPELTLSSATQTICRAEGTLPFVIHPGNTNGLLTMKADGALRWSAFTETNSVFWDELATRSRLNLRNPRLTVDVSGTWAKPQGVMQLSAERIAIRTDKPMPRVDELNFDLKMNREMADAHLTTRIQDQPVTADARLPLGRGFWEGLRRTRKLPDTREATGEFTIQNAQIAPFAEFVPTILAPQGEFSLNVKLSPGNQLSGDALLYNATTRPLPSLGPVRSIDGKMLFAGRAVVLTNLSGEIGGQRVTAMGSAQLTDSFMLGKTVIPPFDLRVIGTNVPLVRQASAIVRADLNLAITNTAQAIGSISGNVRLRDSFFLSSLKGLAPGKVASPKRRPPYFSVEVEPFAGWKLGVDVTGEKFLHVQSPFFRGVASTTLRLEGSLKEPLALGEVRIHSGLITFPFGNLQVQQGFVSLTSADPYRPRLFVNATAQRMGYDIKLEASGPADQPTLQFSSSPPLSSEQIVLMLTTGQTPQGMATSTTTRQRAQGLALFVGKNILTDLGLSGNGEERLTIRSGEEVTETGKPTYDVEYKLTDDWSVVGEYDRFNQYNLGLKWRVYTK